MRTEKQITKDIGALYAKCTAYLKNFEVKLNKLKKEMKETQKK